MCRLIIIQSYSKVHLTLYLQAWYSTTGLLLVIVGWHQWWQQTLIILQSAIIACFNFWEIVHLARGWMGESFWQKDSLITHILFELQPIMIFSLVSKFGDPSLHFINSIDQTSFFCSLSQSMIGCLLSLELMTLITFVQSMNH